MKKLTLMMALVLLMVLTCAGLSACSSGVKNGTTQAQTQKPGATGVTTSTAKPASGGSDSFDGVPI